MTEGQLAFDIEGMIHAAAVEAAPEWTGAPLSFTAAYFSPADLDAAHAHWQFLHMRDGASVQSRMWRRSIAFPAGADVGTHRLDLFAADLRCEPWKHGHPHDKCACVGDLMYLAICELHAWHGIFSDENTAAEVWHDHAFPGWRDLPIVPARLRSTDKPGLSTSARKWIERHYPTSAQVVGAPVITERSGLGTRHVPGRSPWGGYDISHTAVDPNRTISTAQSLRQSHESPSRARSAASAGTSVLGV